MDTLADDIFAMYKANPCNYDAAGNVIPFCDRFAWKTVVKHVLQKKVREMGDELPDEVAIQIVNKGWGDERRIIWLSREDLDEMEQGRVVVQDGSDASMDQELNDDDLGDGGDWPYE